MNARADAMSGVGWVERSDTRRSVMASAGNDGYRPAASTHPTVLAQDVGRKSEAPSAEWHTAAQNVAESHTADNAATRLIRPTTPTL